MKHEFKRKWVKSGDCGSHYCDGHEYHYAVCSCGIEISLGSWSDDKWKDDIEQIKHILEAEGLGKLL